MSNSGIEQRLASVRERIAAAAGAAGRMAADVRLIAVSKTVDAAAVAEAFAAGQTVFGENRVQDLAEKAVCLPADVEWHLIGHLQKNKARAAIQTASWIHSVDSLDLLERLERIAGEEDRHPQILLQVNMTGESTKSGLDPAGVADAVERACRCTNLVCCGFMTMAEFEADEAALRACFGGLRRLRDEMSARYAVPLPELSMGMSGDFEIAIAEGATMVRVGTAIFGPRH